MSGAAPVAGKRTNGRSAVSNGARLFATRVDGRTLWARRYRDLVAGFAADAGGLETLTQLKLALIRRAAALTVECERLEGQLADGQQIDTDLLARLSSHLRRIAESIGLDRVQRDVTQSIDAIAARHRADPE